MSDTATMHIDGAARGNPGPASYAVVLARPGHRVVEEADTIGTATNNVAEYTALLRGLELAAEMGVKSLAVFSDSELMVKQMNGEYRVKHPDLLPLYEEANRLKRAFSTVSITHVRRAQNARADAIGNEALDGKPRKRGAPPVEETSPPNPLSRGERGNKSSPPSFSGKGGGGLGSSDATVRDDALTCLTNAANHWAARGLAGLPVEAVWDQLWFLLDEAGVLKKKKAK